MAEKNSYPQIPTTVWWGVRAILQRSPGVTLDERMLSVQLGVQEAATRQYLAELKRVGVLSEEGKATPVAQRWRLDETYLDAVDEILAATYPEGLLHVAPPGEADRQKVISWFLHEGLGSGAANNKAATYLTISSREPNEAPGKPNSTRSSRDDAGKKATASRSAPAKSSPRPDRGAVPANSGGVSVGGQSGGQRGDMMPLNINIQIHISADAGSEQIESIFSAMKRYLHDEPGR